ncbi:MULTISPECIES: hypothetical protein [unclassified Mesorhizobium]|uniref:hypothetical protein n=1 Tax=unclassified Mesorhizobium TaxID=325217 RepID=UPI000FCAC3D7|nr:MULTISPECIES: hypothetical protein [unclassified Mesorhizobium]RUU25658.1 hypothetical protein EOC94_30350 [Mesorhizobium sp. M6A.T.Ce.TU.016.01.1.1]RVB71907.1 hypothetical protein EN885_31125 [Mesorhizobium sp. M6A.T.Cr.TU.014.01.1.1]RWP77246.1 MAG: hypothetical protein EOR10_16055 [Mesorhizobium sp.]RWP96910.1 MAG: hypothetical protein EOR90_29245 [Mesorhizobium sp.]RWP97878.1 MAG: hypothetical protein EOR91_28940 [Mesorhizobium sp.]
MPVQRKAEAVGIFNSSELALLGRVFDRLKVDHQSEQQREVLASRIIANYMAGVVDEEELLSASKQPLGR